MSGAGLLGTFQKDKTNANDKRSWKIAAERIYDVPLSKIKADPAQPRKHFDNGSLDSLAASIKKQGIISPIELREENGSLHLLVGERRVRAAKLAGLKSLPAFIRPTVDELDRRVRQLIENIQREDLSVLDQAVAFQALIDSGMTQAGIAKAVGKSRTAVTKIILCGKFFQALPGDLQARCSHVNIPPRVFYQIASQKPHEKAVKALRGLLDESPQKGKKRPQKASKPVSVPTTGALSKALGKVETKDLSKILLDVLPPASVAKIYQALRG